MYALIPIVSVVSVFSTAVLIVAIVMYIHYKKEVMRNKERMAAIEKGIPLPANGGSSRHDDSCHSSLRGGIVLLFVGAGLALALWVNAGLDGAVWGVFVALIGVGKLVYWVLAGRKEETALPPDVGEGSGGTAG